MGPHRITRYRVFISHRYFNSAEYRRLVSMLDRAQQRDPTWRWENLSISLEEARAGPDLGDMADVYERHIKKRLDQVHVILYIARGDWLGDLDSLYLELIEGTPRYRTRLPIVSVLPRGWTTRKLERRPPGELTVKWHAASIIQAIRHLSLPTRASELRLSSGERAHRRQIQQALAANAWQVGKTAASLGIGLSTLRRMRMRYLIR